MQHIKVFGNDAPYKLTFCSTLRWMWEASKSTFHWITQCTLWFLWFPCCQI